MSHATLINVSFRTSESVAHFDRLCHTYVTYVDGYCSSAQGLLDRLCHTLIGVTL